VAVVLIARFPGDVDRLTRAYDEAHRIIMDRGGPPGELRHHCALDEDALYLIGVWEGNPTREVGEPRVRGHADVGRVSFAQGCRGDHPAPARRRAPALSGHPLISISTVFLLHRPDTNSR
jgi:hypothetical protein